jgi:hypothetical protein
MADLLRFLHFRNALHLRTFPPKAVAGTDGMVDQRSLEPGLGAGSKFIQQRPKFGLGFATAGRIFRVCPFSVLLLGPASAGPFSGQACLAPSATKVTG